MPDHASAASEGPTHASHDPFPIRAEDARARSLQAREGSEGERAFAQDLEDVTLQSTPVKEEFVSRADRQYRDGRELEVSVRSQGPHSLSCTVSSMGTRLPKIEMKARVKKKFQ